MRAGGRAVLSNLRNNLRWSDQNLRIARSFFAPRLNFRFDRNAETVTVTLPVLPALAATWAAGPCGDLTYVVGAGGGPLKKESFGNAFRKAYNAAGVPGSAHGICKLTATRAAEKGATEHELDAIFGWRGGAMSREYTREANRARMSVQAMHKLANDSATSIPAPDDVVRAAAGKQQ